MTQKITPFLMYNHSLDEVLDFYKSVFKDFNVSQSTKGPDGKIQLATFHINGQEIRSYNGGSHFTFNDGMSLFIDCETQEDIDYLWKKLSEGGAKSQCGWLQDQFGVYWQIVPIVLMKMITDEDREKADRATQAMLKMSKLDIAELERAFNAK